MQSAVSVKEQSVATSGYIDYKSTIIFSIFHVKVKKRKLYKT